MFKNVKNGGILNHLFILLFGLVAHSAFAIQGGQPVDWRTPMAASAISLGETSSGTLVRSFCSGTLISSRAIVTAAHCLAGKTANQIQVLFATNGLTTNEMRTGNQIIVPASYQPYGDTLPGARDNSDIAILVFNGGIPSGFQPAVIVQTEIQSSSNGASLMISGYGLPNAGILNACAVTLLDGAFSKSEIQLTSSTACSPATGDSGGAVYLVKGKQVYLYGIHNWGWHDTNGNPSYSVETRVSFYYSWMLQNR